MIDRLMIKDPHFLALISADLLVLCVHNDSEVKRQMLYRGLKPSTAFSC